MEFQRRNWRFLIEVFTWNKIVGTLRYVLIYYIGSYIEKEKIKSNNNEIILLNVKQPKWGSLFYYPSIAENLTERLLVGILTVTDCFVCTASCDLLSMPLILLPSSSRRVIGAFISFSSWHLHLNIFSYSVKESKTDNSVSTFLYHLEHQLAVCLTETLGEYQSSRLGKCRSILINKIIE